jgi:ribosomal protein S18 acetylase RimI-like enzyme
MALFKRVNAHATRPLRHTVLRPQQRIEEAAYPLDDVEESYHVGAFLGDEIVSVASVYHEARPGEEGEDSWRLRGMATLPELRRRGYGTNLLRSCIEYVAKMGGSEIWCNARSSAAGFYEGLGFEPVGDEFDLPLLGPHQIMRRAVGPEDLNES